MPAPRVTPPGFATADIDLAAPPEVPRAESAPLLPRLLPILTAVAMVAVTAALYRSGAVGARSPVLLVFPAMMVVSAGVAAVSGRGRYDIDLHRAEYLAYLRRLRVTVDKTAAAQRSSLRWCHPDPDALWALVGGARMWERRPGDSDFGQLRVGVATLRLATRLVPPRIDQPGRADPVTVAALRGFLRTHSTLPAAPIAIDVRDLSAVWIAGEPGYTRAVLRALICQLAVLHSPDRMLVAAAVGDRGHWEWLKWLPHNQHPAAVDAAGPVRMVYSSLVAAATAVAGVADDRRRVVLVIDDDATGSGEEQTGLRVLGGGSGAGVPLRLRVTADGLAIRWADGDEEFARPDLLDVGDALVCARRLAAYRPGSTGAPGWPDLLAIGDVTRFDPPAVWRRCDPPDRLRVPIGTTAHGAPVHLDIKEAAENGMGPHGLCIGATGSGKSEFLRTLVLGMLARHSPAELNVVLVDFKGGATFLGLGRARHVAAVITNLADEAPLVERMRDALTGEMNRRQELLRNAGNVVGITAYRTACRDARRAGAPLPVLPALFIVIDEFSELLCQHPDLVDTFAAIGRLGRSLGMHLLLASQRLDEGRLRGLESHLSYRICLKTLSPQDSRAVIGVPDGYELPNHPGAGYLRTADAQLIRFQAAYVSCPASAEAPVPGRADPPVREFTAAPAGAVSSPAGPAGRSVLAVVLDRLADHGPVAHQVWLPPLGAPPDLHTLLGDANPPALTAPIGLVDRPVEQRRSPLVADVSGAAGNVAVVGAPQSGKSTALCTLITALAATHDPARVQFYCLDFGGGALASVRGLPHVGSVAGRTEPDLARRTVAELESLIRARAVLFRDHGVASMAEYRRLRAGRDAAGGIDRFGDVFLVVDGWAVLRTEFGELEERIVALAGQGLSFGVHVALSASRWADFRPALKDQLGTRIELRLGDPADSELDRSRARQVPVQPGRGLTDDGLHMVIAAPRCDAALIRRGGSAAPPVPLLPARVDRRAVIARAGDRGQVLVGLRERDLRPAAIDFGQHPHLLILGDSACGKTAALRTLCQEITRTTTAEQAQLVVVDYRRTLLGAAGTERLGGFAMSAATLATQVTVLVDRLHRRMPSDQVGVAQLRARSWWSGPDIYLIIDDYDLVTAATNPLTPILDYLPHARDVGLHLVVARRSGGAARAMFEPLLAGLRDAGGATLVMSANPDEGPLLGSVRPEPLPPGRGILVTRADGAQLVQVAWSPPP